MKSKLIIIFILLLSLSACKITPTPVLSGDEEPTDEPKATETFTPEPAQVEEKTPEPTETFTPEPVVDELEETPSCTQLLTPEDGAELPSSGQVTFSWQPVEGAALYQLYILFPTEVDLTFELAETSITRYTESFSMHPAYHQGGEHQWNVTALNAEGEIICSSDFLTFRKPDSISTPENRSQGDGGGDGGEDPGDGPVDSG
ncbi:MAG: hypothetical protein HN392_09550 [Anaerolineae bacterium]|jgi:hypothetical protein|nr:hypothetical protein [Anaerolineae bacterium]MBT7074998.1 hypothetical protein [Anaerolineae bacterium]MBT7781634.1 hypothetical protein [Anaerolineae bacterium]